MTCYIVIAVLAVLAIYTVWAYNGLVKLRNKVREAYSTMDVYLKKRHDLVPNLVAIVRGYAEHESATLENLAKTRSSMIASSDFSNLGEQLAQETRIGDALVNVMAVAERYPDLKANGNFLDLQDKLVAIEDDIAFSRRYYNGSVRQMNNQCETFPMNIFASLFGFKKQPMFAVGSEQERKASVIGAMLMLLALVLPQTALADDGGYYIRNYKVEATVSKANVWDVTETVDLTFTEPRHGFYRYVPCRFSVPFIVEKEGRQDSIRLSYYCETSNESVDGWEYETDSKDDNTVFRIGDADKTVTGEQTYVIHYTYTYPDDRLAKHTDKPFDFIQHTLLPVDCNVPIEHFEFSVKYEKPLPYDIKQRLDFYYGAYGDVEKAENLSWEVKNNTISGEMDGIAPKHTVTVYAKLDEGFFENAAEVDGSTFLWLFWIAVALIVLTIVLELSTKQPQIVKSIEFYPPEDISSAEVGTIIDEAADLIDLTSLIPWWASKGYITIEETEKKKLLGKETVLTLNKIKELPESAPSYQRKFFRALFGSETTVTLSDIGEKPQEILDAQRKLSKVFTGEKRLSRLSWNLAWLLPTLVVSVATFFYASSVEIAEPDTTLFGFFLLGATSFINFIIVAIVHQYEWTMRSWVKNFWLGVRLVLLVAPLAVHIYIINGNADLFIAVEQLAVLYIGMFVAVEFSTRFSVNTQYRADMMGRLLGLKEFIETAEQQQLASLQREDPKYFYRILPFAMVFGLTDKWSSLFKNIEVEQPDWYRSQSSLTNYLLVSNIAHHITTTAYNSIQVISHDSSSSSRSGGGISGGGGGGGGCGSW